MIIFRGGGGGILLFSGSSFSHEIKNFNPMYHFKCEMFGSRNKFRGRFKDFTKIASPEITGYTVSKLVYWGTWKSQYIAVSHYMYTAVSHYMYLKTFSKTLLNHKQLTHKIDSNALTLMSCTVLSGTCSVRQPDTGPGTAPVQAQGLALPPSRHRAWHRPRPGNAV